MIFCAILIESLYNKIAVQSNASAIHAGAVKTNDKLIMEIKITKH